MRRKDEVDEEICWRGLPHHGRAKTSARLVGTPFGYACLRAGSEPFGAR
jgi:hypothetical protein